MIRKQVRTVSLEEDNVVAEQPKRDMAYYAPLGLISNPFEVSADEAEPGVACEITAAGNRLLGAILEKSQEAAPKPLWVEKAEIVPASYCLFAVSHAEKTLATDDTMNVLYGYVQLFMMKMGLVRSTLSVVAERLSFRSPDRTIERFVAKALAEPDESMTSYQVLGPERLEAFAAKFHEDPSAATESVFGKPEVEKRPELAEEFDVRMLALDDDVDESDTSVEVDGTLGDAPGTAQLLEEAAENMEDDQRAVSDYLVEYAREHVSPVIGRGLRVYRERGMAALADELKVTRAPRKTLAKLVEFAGLRYRKVALIYDSFESWGDIDQNLRAKLVGAMSDLRWNTDGDAFPVFIVVPGEAPELEEVFGQGPHLMWDFPGLLPMQEHYDEVVPEVVDGWLASATLPGSTPISLGDAALSQLANAANGSLNRFIGMAHASFENAAQRGLSALDDEAVEAGKVEGVE